MDIFDDWIDLGAYGSELDRLHDASQVRIWLCIEQFGMVIDHDCPGQDLVGFYKNPDKELDGTWYFPSGTEVDLELIDIDHPPRVDVAYDSKGVAA